MTIGDVFWEESSGVISGEKKMLHASAPKGAGSVKTDLHLENVSVAIHGDARLILK